MDTDYKLFSKLSLQIPEGRYKELEEKAIRMNTSVSDLLTLFVADLVNETTEDRPVSTLIHNWYQNCLPPCNDTPSFVQWMDSSYRLGLFFCLLDSFFFNVEQFTASMNIRRDQSRNEFCIQCMHNLMLETFSGVSFSEPGSPQVMLKDFPIDAKTHINHIFESIADLYDEYIDYTAADLDEDEDLFLLSIFSLFDLWKERKLRY